MAGHFYGTAPRECVTWAPIWPATQSDAYGVNNKGQVVGESYYKAFIWQDGTLSELHPLPGWGDSVAKAINDHGVAVGNSINRACLWERDGTVVALGNLGADPSFARAINNRGQVVGASRTVQGKAGGAFLWQNGKMIGLNDLIPPDSGWVLVDATGINDRGQIVGNASYKGQRRAFLLTPIK